MLEPFGEVGAIISLQVKLKLKKSSPKINVKNIKSEFYFYFIIYTLSTFDAMRSFIALRV